MRIFSVAVLAASLLSDGAWAAPLRPGYPAGVRAARGDTGDSALMIGMGAVLLAGVGILASGDSSAVDTLQITSQPIIVPPPTITVSTSTTGTP